MQLMLNMGKMNKIYLSKHYNHVYVWITSERLI